MRLFGRGALALPMGLPLGLLRFGFVYVSRNRTKALTPSEVPRHPPHASRSSLDDRRGPQRRSLRHAVGSDRRVLEMVGLLDVTTPRTGGDPTWPDARKSGVYSDLHGVYVDAPRRLRVRPSLSATGGIESATPSIVPESRPDTSDARRTPAAATTHPSQQDCAILAGCRLPATQCWQTETCSLACSPMTGRCGT